MYISTGRLEKQADRSAIVVVPVMGWDALWDAPVHYENSVAPPNLGIQTSEPSLTRHVSMDLIALTELLRR